MRVLTGGVGPSVVLEKIQESGMIRCRSFRVLNLRVNTGRVCGELTRDSKVIEAHGREDQKGIGL